MCVYVSVCIRHTPTSFSSTLLKSLLAWGLSSFMSLSQAPKVIVINIPLHLIKYCVIETPLKWNPSCDDL